VAESSQRIDYRGDAALGRSSLNTENLRYWFCWREGRSWTRRPRISKASSRDVRGLVQSKHSASCSRDNREPASLSSACKPGGTFVHTTVTSVPPDTSSKLDSTSSRRGRLDRRSRSSLFRRSCEEASVSHREPVLPVRRLAARGPFGRRIEPRHPISSANSRAERVNLACHVRDPQPSPRGPNRTSGRAATPVDVPTGRPLRVLITRTTTTPARCCDQPHEGRSHRA
jgi:hypothetical protein